MRATLATLGIIIGVAAVIAMMEIGQGFSGDIQKKIASMGANNLLILPGAAASGGISFGVGSAMTLTPDDCAAIATECTAVRAVAPIARTRNSQIIYGNRNWIPNQIAGTTPDYLEVRDWTDMTEGEPFTDRDIRNRAQVCIVGQTIQRELFQGESPVGKEIRIQNISFKVVGVLSAKGANAGGQDQDDIILAPWTTIKYRVSGSTGGAANQGSTAAVSSVNNLDVTYPGAAETLYPVPSDIEAADVPLPVRFSNVDQIMAAAASASEIQLAIRQITALLHERHKIAAGAPDDFQIRDMTEMANSRMAIASTMDTLLKAVAAISLLVGGIGIMNIMLVSVTERTREIGLRMAVGAQGRDILWQFLVEAVSLCLGGGLVGIIIGHWGSTVCTYFLHWPKETSIAAIVASIVVSGSVGIIFGFYPAWKASRLDPIEALRYE
jgi:ABC-type antimicrobial peptide transport system permease subunit